MFVKTKLALAAQFLTALVLVNLLSGSIQAATAPAWLVVEGRNQNGTTTPITEYRYLIEEDLTYTGVCTQADIDSGYAPCVGKTAGERKFDPNTVSVGFHKSHMPVVASGCVGFTDAAWMPCDAVGLDQLQPNKRYYISILSRTNDFALGGTGFETDGTGAPRGGLVTVGLNAGPVPWAQITFFVFEDIHPINNVPDDPNEQGLEGFQIVLEDAGGRYGASAGSQIMDVFGNFLGTTYHYIDTNGNGIHEATEPLVLEPDGTPSIKTLGTGTLLSGPDGHLTVKYMAPGKYGTICIPPAGQGWQLTSTIEGTQVVDAWVKANEPPFFAEFGPPGYHAFFGFVRPFNSIPTVLGTGTTTISGQVVNMHMSRPPDYTFYAGAPFSHTRPWVGLNLGPKGQGVFAAPTDDDGNFSIPNVPPGNYQLVFWDSNVDLIFTFKDVVVNADGTCGPLNQSCALGPTTMFNWFARLEHFVFNDLNANGFWDVGELPLMEQNVNLRWRDGTLYQSFPTDGDGFAPFDTVFPFFAWLVAEVDFARFEATGVTVVVDNGGGIDPANPWTFGGQLNPQNQTNPPTGPGTESQYYRVETGPVLAQAFQGFLGQTSVMQWGKKHYDDGENGGVSGVVYYAATRAENDPEMAAVEPWEPGIPRVTVNLYDSTGTVLINTATTDSWDDNIPTGCKYGNQTTGFFFDPDGPGPIAGRYLDCYDGLRNFNQVRPGVFDGGYAFTSACGTLDAFGKLVPAPVNPDGSCSVGDFASPIPAGDYQVGVVPPTGYEVIRPEHKNVDFGDNYVNPPPALLPPPCVGASHTVPAYLTLYPDDMIPAPFAGQSVPLCDRKLVSVSAGANTAADFFLMTEVPRAAQGYGFILDDTQNEFDANSPNFGEKYAPPFLPVAIRDWTGRMIASTVGDQFGVYNFLGPSTSTMNQSNTSGASPQMLTTCMNDPEADPTGTLFNPQYSTFCYVFQYMSGTTTYLDTPVVPVAAHAGPDQFPLDCEFPDGTPRIYSVSNETNGVGGGPYIPLDSRGRTSRSNRIRIVSVGTTPVINPVYCNPMAGLCPAGADTINPTILRDYGFGASSGTVRLGNRTLSVSSWSPTEIVVNLGSGVTIGNVAGLQLTVSRADNGLSTVTGVTVQAGLRRNASVVNVAPSGDPLGFDIQEAIDSAGPNDLILVSPGEYMEAVIMWKPVQLQGWGEGSTVINAVRAPFNKIDLWRTKVEQLWVAGVVSLVPGQKAEFGGVEPVALFPEELAGVLILGTDNRRNTNHFDLAANRGARIDGFTIRGADVGGGITLNGFAPFMDLSNNRIINNNGTYGGGIRVGHPELFDEILGTYTDAQNDRVRIHHNHILKNGGLGGAGGGIALCTGADSYEVSQNYVCGNFTLGHGGGIGHLGLSGRSNGSPMPTIRMNTVIFNEGFNQGLPVSGGGIFIGGGQPLVVGGLTPGSGSVSVIGNLVQGNAAQAGNGGGIDLELINGRDVLDNPTDQSKWHSVEIFNNIIVDNVAASAGGGIALHDAVNVKIIHNTIANNDNTSTAGATFTTGNPNVSSPRPGAGIVSFQHSPTLLNASNLIGTFSNPTLDNNIVSHNRQFLFFVQEGVPASPSGPAIFGLCPSIGGSLDCSLLPADLGIPAAFRGTAPVYNDLAVIGVTGSLTCSRCLLTGAGAPGFVSEYWNGSRTDVAQTEITTIQATAALDEGGNFIRLKFGPLSLFSDATPNDGDPGVLFGDYHLTLGSPARNAGGTLFPGFPALTLDFDRQTRPSGSAVDIGADEQP